MYYYSLDEMPNKEFRKVMQKCGEIFEQKFTALPYSEKNAAFYGICNCFRNLSGINIESRLEFFSNKVGYWFPAKMHTENYRQYSDLRAMYCYLFAAMGKEEFMRATCSI